MAGTSINLKAVVVWALVVGLISLCIYFFFPAILMLAFAILLAMIIDPLVSMCESMGLRRNHATLIVFAGGGALLYTVLSLFVPNLLAQLANLSERLKAFSIKDQLNTAEASLMQVFPFLAKGLLVNKFEAFVSGTIQHTLDQITTLISDLFSAVILLAILPFMTYFIVKDRQMILKGLLHLLPNSYFEMSYWIFKRISKQLGKYVRGWLIDAIFVGTACGVGFSIIGIPNPVALGIIAGIGHLVPYFGPVIGGIPALLLSVVQNGNLSALPLLLLVIVIIYGLDNGIVQPYVFSKSVDMHPLIIIILIIAGSSAFGIVGMLFAVPAATVIKTASSEFYFALKSYKIARI